MTTEEARLAEVILLADDSIDMRYAAHLAECIEREYVAERVAQAKVEAMDLFQRFWDARVDADDWQSAFPDWPNGCDCGNCFTCGMRHALSWTHALLSNPALADKAEELKGRRFRPAVLSEEGDRG